MDQFELYLQFHKELAASKLKVIEQFQKGGRTKSLKRTSKIDIARNVLKGAGKPLHVTEIVRMAKKAYDVQLDRDSIVSIILIKQHYPVL